AFGCCLLIDCHSMPSLSSPPERSPGRGPVDVVLGDCYGVSCAEWVVQTAEDFLESKGYAIQRNIPYAGGFTTRHYGRPSAGIHVMQIEINRALYMNESTFERAGDFTRLCEHMSQLVLFLGRAAGALAGR
ncbi:MAG: N-formylglutamate amidohydrolase, partial [Alphaproteobacteria bacterium]